MLFELLKGVVIADIQGCSKYSREIVFTTTEGRVFRMFHRQDCCERVSVEDVVGDVEDIIGSPVLRAEERSNCAQPVEDGYGDVEQWTFYTIATIKGTVDLRWLGTSNGYYGTGVDFEEEITQEERVLLGIPDQLS